MSEDRIKIITSVIINTKLKKATSAEREILLAWLRENKDNIELYKKIIRGESIKERFLSEKQIAESMDTKAIRYHIEKLIRQRRNRSMRKIATWSAAACFAVMITLFLNHNSERNSDKKTEQLKIADICLHQIAKVILTQENGTQIDLMDSTTRNIDNATIKNGTICYADSAKIAPINEVKHKIELLAGSQYALTLSDGTKVWLNAETTFEFPIVFINEERVVKLSGEAYFEVAANSERPFIVECDGQLIKVLGTSFNINAYSNEPTIRTTLLTGKVEVSSRETGRSVTLTPGRQSFLDTKSGYIGVAEVDPSKAISWKDGVFYFVNEDLKSVTRILSRLYGVHFLYNQNLKSHTINGNISIKEDLNDILETITLIGGPIFKIEKDSIYIIDK